MVRFPFLSLALSALPKHSLTEHRSGDGATETRHCFSSPLSACLFQSHSGYHGDWERGRRSVDGALSRWTPAPLPFTMHAEGARGRL